MPRPYTCGNEGFVWGPGDGDLDFFEFNPGANNRPLALTDLQITTTDLTGEAEEQWIRLKFIRGHTTSGSGGLGDQNPRPVFKGDPAAGFLYDMNNDAVAAAGTAVDVIPGDAFQVRDGYELHLGQDDWIWTSDASGLLVVRGMQEPASGITWSGVAYVMEFP